MKIAIPAVEKNENSIVCMSYGRTYFFAVYDTDAKTYTFLDNSANSACGGAGIKASQMLVDNGVTAVITQRLGSNAAAVLNASNVKIYRAVKNTIAENIEDYLNNKLPFLTTIHEGFHGNGNNNRYGNR